MEGVHLPQLFCNYNDAYVVCALSRTPVIAQLSLFLFCSFPSRFFIFLRYVGPDHSRVVDPQSHFFVPHVCFMHHIALLAALQLYLSPPAVAVDAIFTKEKKPRCILVTGIRDDADKLNAVARVFFLSRIFITATVRQVQSVSRKIFRIKISVFCYVAHIYSVLTPRLYWYKKFAVHIGTPRVERVCLFISRQHGPLSLSLSVFLSTTIQQRASTVENTHD